eukprot:TRINITY_DN3046_c0_g1_i7.p1 TRINITY_DN3046_c0_g1~~TRINITY_DN3046_c0_g1_i7.p1  ORF type:complete len:535 (+),score=92.84 TRINITY_DN3046_c0_g1_i7:49-1653(+)
MNLLATLLVVWCVFVALCAATCSDGVRDGDEVKVDCGGSCSPCEWPFNAVSRATLRSYPRKVYAHWHYYPIAMSKGNATADYFQTQYIPPTGENNKHIAYGGMMRERPLPRQARTETNWQALDAEADIRLAAQMGLDGYYLNMWTMSDTNNGGLWTRWVNVVDAAARVGSFDIVPNMDLSIMGSMSDLDATNLVLNIYAALKSRSSLLKTSSGQYVLGAFYADKRSAAWYANLKTRASAEQGIRFYIVGVFLGSGSDALFSALSGPVDEFAGWGTAIPTTVGSFNRTKVAAAKYGKPWLQPVSNQDFRPYTAAFWEAANTKTIRTQWETVITDKIANVQLVTWNDQAEHHAVRPSTGKQWVAYDLNAYYIQWFKTNVKPVIKREMLFYSHRLQNLSAPYDTTKQTKPFVCKANCPGSDLVEVVAFLLTPGTLEIAQGSSVTRKDVSAGLQTLTATLRAGAPTFRLIRNGATVITLKSSFTAVTSVTYQDFLYRGGSSSRVALTTSSGSTCAAFCVANNVAKCNWCAADPMWLLR